MSERWPPDGLSRAVRDAARGSGWSAWSGTVSRVDAGLAFHACEFAGRAQFFAKPVAWDECIWTLLELETPPRRSPSFHFRGVKAPVPPIAAAQITARDAATVASELLAFADAEHQRASRHRLDDFPTLLRMDVAQTGRDDFAISEAAWHLVEGRPEAARAIAAAVRDGMRRPGVHVSAGRDGRGTSFFEAVLLRTSPEHLHGGGRFKRR